MSAIPNPNQKPKKMGKLNPNSDRKENPTLSTSASKSGPTDKDSDRSKSSGNPKMDVTDRLGTDGKLTPQERQQHFDNELCLLCSKSGHMVCDCPKSTKARAAKASNSKSSETKAEFPVNASEAKN